MDKEIAGEHDKRDGKTEPEDQEEQVSLGRPRHGQDIVDRHGYIGYDDEPHRLEQACGLFAALITVPPADKELYGNPDDQDASDELYEHDLQELGGKEGKRHTQDYGGPCPHDYPLFSLFSREVSHGHGNDHGIVTGQHQVYQHD